MRLSLEELAALSNEQLLEKYTKAIVLSSKEGTDNFDTVQLKDEILHRFESLERLLKVYHEDDDGGMVGEP